MMLIRISRKTKRENDALNGQAENINYNLISNKLIKVKFPPWGDNEAWRFER